MKISCYNVVLNLFCVLALDTHIMPFSFLILIGLRKYIENFQRSCTVGSTNPNFYPCKSERCKNVTLSMQNYSYEVMTLPGESLNKGKKRNWNSYFS